MLQIWGIKTRILYNNQEILGIYVIFHNYGQKINILILVTFDIFTLGYMSLSGPCIKPKIKKYILTNWFTCVKINIKFLGQKTIRF